MRFLVPWGGDIGNHYGVLTAPHHSGVVESVKAGKPWAADLGCVAGPDYVKRLDFDEALAWLEVMKPHRARCLFLAGGDAVADAARTLELWSAFADAFRGWPLAYVAQDGSESLPMPHCGTLFIGGSTDWKESMAAVDVIKRAQSNGMHVHIGRLNWGARFRRFRVLSGSHRFTCDGTRQRFDGVEKTSAAWLAYEAQPPLLTI